MKIKQILEWADAHHERIGKWPQRNSGHARGSRGKSWQDVDHALIKGRRGIPAGGSLAGLLYDRRGVTGPRNRSPIIVVPRPAWPARRIVGGPNDGEVLRRSQPGQAPQAISQADSRVG